MACYVRLMRKEDIAQVTEIDREAFPTNWPPPNYQHELRNQLARYTVACDGEKMVESDGGEVPQKGGVAGLLSRLKRFFNGNSDSGSQQPASGHYITGFIGCWIMADEAHVTSIAVRESYRRQGIGERLLISAIDLAIELKASIVALEVRVSNTGAQSLYSKYGFNRVGLRKGYYIDNKEDAILMSTDSIASESFQKRFQKLKEAYFRKQGKDVS